MFLFVDRGWGGGQKILLDVINVWPLINPLNANPTKWSKTHKQFVDLQMNCLIVLDHFVEFALKGLRNTVYRNFLIQLESFISELTLDICCLAYFINHRNISTWFYKRNCEGAKFGFLTKYTKPLPYPLRWFAWLI